MLAPGQCKEENYKSRVLRAGRNESVEIKEQGLESRTGGRLVSPAASSEKKNWNPLYFELRMYI